VADHRHVPTRSGELPTGELRIAAPPGARDASPGLLGLLQVLGSLGSTLLVVAWLGTGGGRLRLLVAVLLAAGAAVGLVVALAERRRTVSRNLTGPRAAYLHYLATVATTAREAATGQRTVLLRRHPAPTALPTLVEVGPPSWPAARTTGLTVRYGVCDQPPTLTLLAPEPDPSRPWEPASTRALDRLLAVHAVQPDLPAVLDLRSVDRVDVCGPEEESRALVRALVCSAVAGHPPTALAVVVLTEPGSLPQWDWVKWLPHARPPGAAPDARASLLTSAEQVAAVLPRRRHLLLVVEGDLPVPDLPPGTTVLRLLGVRAAPADVRIVLGVGTTRRRGEEVPAVCEGPGEDASAVLADQCDGATAEALARRLDGRGESGGDGAGDLLHLLGLPDVRRLDPAAARRAAPGRLRVPIGVDDTGHPVHLDLEESARGGMGPHGLLVGATGSGKSELLRTLVLGLALTHSPDRLHLVLIDFKGGLTFAGLADLPHVSALVTNLDHDLALVDRMHDVLSGELVRRQEVLRASGCESADAHERARAGGSDLPPLAPLVVVVDEFSELLSARPGLTDLFVAIGRLGRALGLHLLLASQRLEEGRLHGLESHLSYRIALRTFSVHESRAVLGTDDAHALPPDPGLGYLRTGPARAVRLRACYVSGPLPPDDPGPTAVVPFRVGTVASSPPAAGPTVLDLAVARMRGVRPRARRLWVPPLDRAPTLDALVPDLAADRRLGLVSRRWRAVGGLTLPIGLVDRPREQRQDVWTVTLADSHLAVVGAPRSGTSTLLHTVVAALAVTTSPVEAQVYVLDLAGTPTPYDGLPHVAAVAHRNRPDLLDRVVAEVTGILDRREQWFRERGLDSMAGYRVRRARGAVDDGHGDVFVVVDGWGLLRSEHDDLEAALQDLAARGLGHGIHLVAGSVRWADFRPAVRDLFGTRVELRLGDPADSEVDRHAAALVPRDRPGRALVPGPLHALAALPRIDGRDDPADLGAGLDDLVARVAAAWPGPPAPGLRLLPDAVTPEEVRTAAAHHAVVPGGLLLGLREHDLAPLALDPDTEPHWLVVGDAGSGRSTALRGLVHEVVRSRTPEQARLLLVDPRRSLLGEVPGPHLLRHLTSADRAGPAVAELASYLGRRLPPPEVSAAELRARSWWTGPEVFVVVDDDDLLATAHESPLLALRPLLAQARDVGLHLALARRCGGVSRAWWEPVLGTLRDLATPVLLLSGSPDEGPVVGGLRPIPLPPGRGRLVTRDGVDTVQVAWRPPTG